MTTVLGMALALLTAGMMAAMGIVAARLVQQVQQCAAVNLSMANSMAPEQLDSIGRAITSMPQVAGIHVVSRNEALQRWKEETGEDLVQLLGENPLNATIEVAVNAQWASSDSLASIKQTLEMIPGVVDAASTTRDIDNIMDNARSLMMALAVATAVMLVISLSLVAGMVKLLTYAQRFHIHTMTLVGATTGFIVRPYAWRGAAMGLAAAAIAAAAMGTVWMLMSHSHDTVYRSVAQCIAPADMVATCSLMAVGGMAVGATAAAIAAARYTRATHDELFS